MVAVQHEGTFIVASSPNRNIIASSLVFLRWPMHRSCMRHFFIVVSSASPFLRRFFRVAFSASLLACSKNAAIASGADPGQTPASDVRVYVTNNYEIPLEVFVDGNGSHQRLGVVGAAGNRMFVVPRSLVGN